MNVVHETAEEGGGRRARERARRVDEIAAAAMAMVRAEGLESLTTHRLAGRLELAVGALYRYFPSKSALVAELERRALATLSAHLGRSLAEADGSFRGRNASLARLVLAARAYGRFAREHATEFGLIGQVLADPRNLVTGAEAAALVTATTSVLGAVAGLFEEARGEGLLAEGDAAERAVLYWSGLRGVLELGKLRAHSPGFDAEALADAMTRALLQGFGAEPEAVGRAFVSVRRHEGREREEER